MSAPDAASSHPLWFRQSLSNTLWLLRTSKPWQREWWYVLTGRCSYCGRWDCVD